MTPKLLEVTADDLRRRFAFDAEKLSATSSFESLLVASEEESDPVDPPRAALRDRVAFVSAFDPTTLRSNRSKRDAQLVAEFIAEDCEPVSGPDGQRWRLVLPVRKAVIERATPHGLKALVAASRRTGADDPLVEAAARITRGAFGDVTKMTTVELRAMCVAATWFPATVRVPDIATLLSRIAVLELQEPLRMLVRDGFVGRRKELARLRRYILMSDDPRPLAIFGTGGVGKSTLLAKAVLSASDRPQPPVVAYMTFDRPELRADQPLTLIAEAARQLSAVTTGESQELALKVERQARDSNRRATAALVSRSHVTTSTRTAKRDSQQDLSKLAWQYADIVRRSHPDSRILWVLDTFEVAQRIGDVAVASAFELIDAVREDLGPGFRVVIAGRIAIDDRRIQSIRLEGLDPLTARSLLDREVSGLGLTDAYLDAVLDQLGTNPLSVRLAGELLRREGRKGLRGAEARRRLLFRVGHEEIQGVLYRRILDRLDDEDVRRIANPGLVVRRIDAGVIREVLARPCGLGTVSPDQANNLLERLGREASLVEPAGPGVFVHRADVRAIMLPLIEREDPAKVQQIQKAAVRYHRKRYAINKELIDKTEELYHRLMLGQPAKSLTVEWDRDAALMLQPALDEFPPGSQTYLAERLGWTVDPDVFRAAEDDSWVEQAARLCRQRLDTGDAEGALALARERSSERVRPRMDPIVIEALATLGRNDEALKQAYRTIDWAAEKGDWRTFVAVSVMGARVAEDASQWNRALTLLRGARDVSQQEERDPILHLAAGVAMLRVERRAGTKPTKATAALREVVLAEGRELSSKQRRQNPTLVRDLAAELGSEAPDIVAAATELVGVDLASAAGNELVGSLSSEDRSLFNDFSRSESVHATDFETADAVAPMPLSDSGDTLDWLQSGTSVEQGSRVQEYLGNIAGTSNHGDWTNAIASAFQVDSDASAF
jgi:hypothetical protein